MSGARVLLECVLSGSKMASVLQESVIIVHHSLSLAVNMCVCKGKEHSAKEIHKD